jgi:glycosyltransferase involved in cell wall biosynthesis
MLFEAGDVDQLCHVLELLIEHPVLRRQLAAKARCVAERFSIGASARRMGKIYADLIEGSRRR